jgi:hypothetical protein
MTRESARVRSEWGFTGGVAESDGANAPRGAISAFSPRLRASRPKCAVCFECDELDPARRRAVLALPRARNRAAPWEVIGKRCFPHCMREPE